MKVSPFIFENHEGATFLLIPLLLPNSVFFESFSTNLVQQRQPRKSRGLPLLLTFEGVNGYPLLASRAALAWASRSLRPTDVPLRHRLMRIDNSHSSDEPLISFCRVPQRLLFLHFHREPDRLTTLSTLLSHYSLALPVPYPLAYIADTTSLSLA